MKKKYIITDGIDTSMSYAIYTYPDRLLKHKHAWKVWRTLRDFGCKVYVVAPNLSTFEGSKVYSDWTSLKGKVDVIIPCLRPPLLDDIVETAEYVEAKYIWFQEQNWTPEFDSQCKEKGIGVIRGCVLKHKYYKKPFALFNPCYWHGCKENKVPSKYERI